jgi:hypothetical protein
MMNRNKFLKTLAASVPAAVAIPNLGPLSIQDKGKVKITDVKVMRIKMGNMLCHW